MATQRLKFVLLAQAERQTFRELCAEFRISPKTGYKWLHRYAACGTCGLEDRSHARHHQAETSKEIQKLIVAERRKHPTWGPEKIRVRLSKAHPDLRFPATSTIGDILKRKGLVRGRRTRKRFPPSLNKLVDPTRCNEVWAVDFKGWFRTMDGTRCDPFTITDDFSRMLLRCEIVGKTDFKAVKAVFESAFKEYGLPDAILSDNGPPFATNAIGGFSRLSLWLMKLGIRHIRIEPGHPQQNGRHERMHRTLADEIRTNLQANPRRQQAAFDRFRYEFNHERPHKALRNATPAECYVRSSKRLPKKVTEQLDYPPEMAKRMVRTDGCIQWKGEMVFVSEALVGERVALDRIEPNIVRLYVGQYPTADLHEDTMKIKRL